jgi:integrase/recombinase XerD
MNYESFVKGYERSGISKTVVWKNLDEIDRLAEKAKVKHRLIIRILSRTGLRVSELLSLKVEDVDWENGFFDIIGKGGKRRLVPVDNKTLEQLRNYIKWKKIESGNIFKITRQQVFNICKKYLGIKPHALRHSFAVHCIRNGMDIVKLKEILGHSFLSTTSIYLQFRIKDLKEDYGRIFEVEK